MLIKIVRGNYGHTIGKSVHTKTPKDKPFEVDQKEAERLVKLGIAKIIGAGAAVPAKGSPNKEDPFGDPADDADVSVPIDEDEDDETEYDEDDEDDTEYGEDGEDEDSIPEYGEDSTNAELQSIAKAYGIDVPQHANKAQLLEALDEFFAGAPEINVKEPE